MNEPKPFTSLDEFDMWLREPFERAPTAQSLPRRIPYTAAGRYIIFTTECWIVRDKTNGNEIERPIILLPVIYLGPGRPRLEYLQFTHTRAWYLGPSSYGLMDAILELEIYGEPLLYVSVGERQEGYWSLLTQAEEEALRNIQSYYAHYWAGGMGSVMDEFRKMT